MNTSTEFSGGVFGQLVINGGVRNGDVYRTQGAFDEFGSS